MSEEMIIVIIVAIIFVIDSTVKKICKTIMYCKSDKSVQAPVLLDLFGLDVEGEINLGDLNDKTNKENN